MVGIQLSYQSVPHFKFFTEGGGKRNSCLLPELPAPRLKAGDLYNRMDHFPLKQAVERQPTKAEEELCGCDEERLNFLGAESVGYYRQGPTPVEISRSLAFRDTAESKLCGAGVWGRRGMAD